MSLRQFTLQGSAKVFYLFFIQPQIAVSGHAPRPGRSHRHTFKQLPNEGLQHRGEQHEMLATGGNGGWQFNDAW